jgi:hypothetical protein
MGIMKAIHQFLQPCLLLGREESVGAKTLYNDQCPFVRFFSLYGQYSFQGVQCPARCCARSLLLTFDCPIDCLLGVFPFVDNFDWW